MNPPTVPQAVQSGHDLLLWLITRLDKFPRSRRFTLDEWIDAGLLELLVEEANSGTRRLCYNGRAVFISMAAGMLLSASWLQSKRDTKRFVDGGQLFAA